MSQEYNPRVEIYAQLLVNALIGGSIYALAALGLSLTFRLLRVFNFAHGHLMMAGAYVFYTLRIGAELPLSLTIVGVAVWSLLMAAILLRVFLLPFLRFSLLLPFVTTLALSTILEAIVSIVYGVNVKSLSVGSDLSSMEFVGAFITFSQCVTIGIALLLSLLIGYVLHIAPLGRKVRALAEARTAAEALGIRSGNVSLMGVWTAVFLASIAGILAGFETNIQPGMGTSYSVKAFAAMILGGAGHVWGAVVGAFLLALVENFSVGLDLGTWSIPAGYKDAFSFLVILLILLFRPQGLFGVKRREV